MDRELVKLIEFRIANGLTTTMVLNNPVYEEIWVASYGRGEVCVVGKGEPKVADVLSRIHCFGHRAQCGRLNEVLLGFTLHLFKEGIQVGTCNTASRVSFKVVAKNA